MDKSKIVDELYNATEHYGLIRVVRAVFGKGVSVRLGFSRLDCETRVEDIELSARALNCLKRAGIFTIGDVIDALSRDSLMRIKNLGIKTRNEIKTRLLALSYDSSTEKEKKQILMEIINTNSI